MKVVVIKRPYEVVLEERDMPRIGSEDVLVKTKVSVMSTGTEMALYKGTHAFLKSGKGPYWTSYPIVPGYQNAGEIIEVGENVKVAKVGDKVVCFTGPHQEYVCAPASEALKIPENISYEEAALLPLVTNTMYAVYRAGVHVGDTVAVLGQGLIGMLLTQSAKARGAGRIIATDVFDNKLEVAKRLGADYAINARVEDPVKRIMELTDGKGADLVMEAAGNVEALNQALKMARTRGRILVFARYHQPVELDLAFDFYIKELEILAVRGWGPKFEMYNRTYEYAMRLISAGIIKTKPLITHTFSYMDVKRAYEFIDDKPGETIAIALEW